jgi:hypothetical protein
MFASLPFNEKQLKAFHCTHNLGEHFIQGIRNMLHFTSDITLLCEDDTSLFDSDNSIDILFSCLNHELKRSWLL